MEKTLLMARKPLVNFMIDYIAMELQTLEVDGETMQYLVEKVGMSDQMLRQLVMSSSEQEVRDLLEEKINLNRTNDATK